MAYILGVDVGGTFTDAFLADEHGLAVSAKSPSTPHNLGEGVMSSLRELARQADIPLNEILADTAYVAHGTTAAINALVTGDTAKAGFITTRGHRDSIYIMNLEGRYAGLSADAIQNITQTKKPPPLISKRHVREVTERIDKAGDVVVPLDEDDARRAIRSLLDQDVEAIAVSLLWSFLEPTHERRLRELILEESPDTYVALSSDVSPRIREYARNSTTLVSTLIGPTLRRYLSPLTEQLRAEGLRGPLLVMQGSGGTISAQEAPNLAVTTLGSVLTGGVVGAERLASTLGHENVITTDVGGTTFLVGMIVDGQPIYSTSTIINQHSLNVPTVKVHAIGSGGGAIASVDVGGNLKVGPRSAGAVPGPACYDQGGLEPTVTDAALVLGILNDEFFLGGQKRLSLARAKEALEKLGAPLNLDATEAAAAVFEVQNAQTADLVRKVVVESGFDPRDFVMYAFGGAGPVHCAAYGADLGVRQIVVPLGSTAAAFSAYGLAASDVLLTAELSDPADHPVAATRVSENFEKLERDVADKLDEQGIRFESVTFRREIDIRYSLQMAEVSTPVKLGVLEDADVEVVVADFERKYASLFGEGSGFSAAGYQFMTYRVFGTGHLPFTPTLPTLPTDEGRGSAEALKARRSVFMGIGDGFMDAGIYDYEHLISGWSVDGPAVVEAPTTTVVIPPGSTGTVDRLGNIIITNE